MSTVMRKLLSSWCFILLVPGLCCGRNNVCRHYLAYIAKNESINCYYEPDADTNDLSTIVKYHTGKGTEVYEVTTEDGYILTIHRIPRKNPRGVIWLQHPLAVDALIWVSQSNSSLALLLHEAGYDVWLPSNRGTSLSHRHVNLTIDDYEYWAWTFHEVAIHDYRTVNKFIVENTNRTDIIVIGHSLLTACSLVYASLYPEEARNNVKIFVTMAAPVFFEHLTPLIKFLAPLERIVAVVTNFLEIGSILRYEDHIFRVAVRVGLFLGLDIICGFTFGEQDPRSVGMLATKVPRGFALKMLYHFAQLVQTETKFRQFNYRSRNVDVYGTLEPPEYPLDKITAPFYFIYSDSDALATEKDNDRLYRILPESVKYGRHKLHHINHADYFIGKHVKMIYHHIIDVVNKV